MHWGRSDGRSATRAAVDATARCELCDIGGNESRAAIAHLRESVEVETLPDLALPEAVEMFDRRLKAGLSGRRKYRDDPEAEAEAHDATEGTGRMARAMEAQIVIELRICGQAKTLPVTLQLFDDTTGGPVRGGLRPSSFAPQRSSGEDIEGAGFA
jgi:hypothetical protein